VKIDVFEAILWLRDRKWVGYAAALIGPLLGIGIRLALSGSFDGYPYVSFFPPILLAALIGGRIPGLIASSLSFFFADYYLIEPFGFSIPWPNGWIGLIAFTVVSTTMILIIDFGIQTGARLKKAMGVVRGLNEKLEERVAERTRELTLLTAQLRNEIAMKEVAEAQLRQAQKMQALGQLTSGIAHDFNNMLSIVMGNLGLMRRRLTAAGGADSVELIDNAIDGANRAATLTHQLLAFSRQQPLSPAVTDVNALVSHLGELFRRTLGGNIKLECVMAGGLWRSKVDPGQLENAILNLVVNGRDAMQQGGKLTIETQNAFLDDAYAVAHADVSPGQYVLIAVTDTGTGMSADVANQAFEPFFTTKGDREGTGLGLSQVYGFVKQSGGHVKIYSEVGQGTTVKVYFPRHTAESAPASVAADSETGGASIPRGSFTEIILVVDDDDAVREIHTMMLGELGYTVRSADGGAEALALLESQGAVDLLFTDVVMPEMDGRRLAERAIKLIPNLKVLYTTGYTPNAVVHNGVIDHGVDLLPKPFSFPQLARKIRTVLDRS
jgi:signal transduction histidine kinase/CheY-like chemotaxis protein